ncbi:MAG TPA: hypothetical protein VME46_00355 [Acidimicrobiales bacterium]|nr:hypothetical protein [Acidimicrobiales bacterium]
MRPRVPCPARLALSWWYCPASAAHVGQSSGRDLEIVADAVQEEVMDDRRVWPQCKLHSAGLHTELVDGRASWVCQFGGHAAGAIGQLGRVPPKTKARL